MLLRISIMFMLFLLGQPVFAESTPPVNSAIRAHVEQIRAGKVVSVADQVLSSTVVLPALYERRNYKPVWSNAQATRQLIEALEKIEGDGLVSSDYHLPAILELEKNRPGHLPTMAAGLDMLKTDASSS